MGEVDTSFYVAVLRGISAPASVTNLRVCNVWQDCEGGTADNNPWNTTQWEDGATQYNTFGGGTMHVWNYPTPAVGIHATIRTLKNGLYPRIIREFSSGINGLGVCQAIDASQWGTRNVAAVWAARYPTPRPLYLTTPHMRGDDVKAVQRKLQAKGYNVGPSQADGIYGRYTYNAVKRFQYAHALRVDGIVGPLTRHALGL